MYRHFAAAYAAADGDAAAGTATDTLLRMTDRVGITYDNGQSLGAECRHVPLR